MADERTVGTSRRSLFQATAIAVAIAVGVGVGQLAPVAPASAEKPADAGSQGTDMAAKTYPGKVPLNGADMAQTYVNPIDLPGMAVRNIVGTMPATDTNVANASQIPNSLNQATWTAASGRTLAGRSSVGFTRISGTRHVRGRTGPR